MIVTWSPAAAGKECVAARSRDLAARRLKRFAAPHRPAIEALAARHRSLADLAVSFPALLFALAVPRPGLDIAPVIARAIAGAPLKELARLAGLPMWTRGLCPEAFVKPLPILPDEAFAGRHIANHLPRSPKRAPIWLEAVALFAQWATPAGAAWIARELNHDSDAVPRDSLHAMCLYIWFSGAPGTFAGSLIARPWQPAMRYATALEHARAWLETIDVHATLGDTGIEDVWLTPGEVEGYAFWPLRSGAEIVEEADVMRHCLKGYAGCIVGNRSRIWSVRRDGERVATLELGIWFRDPLLRVKQIRAFGNKAVGKEVWDAALRWLLSHDLLATRPVLAAKGATAFDRAVWLRLWKPYWQAKRRLPPWLPLQPSRQILRAL